jgi:alpha-galactosidase
MTVAVEWREADRQFHLHNGLISYVTCILDDSSLGGVYFGPALAADRSYRHLARGASYEGQLGAPISLEYPGAGYGDFRAPAFAIEHADGSTVTRLAYAGHAIRAGKPEVPGLPSTYVEDEAEARTLEVDVADPVSGARVRLRYTIFRDLPAIARSVHIENAGDAPFRVTCAMSASLDLSDADWEFVHLSGAWARERHVRTRRLAPGRQSIASLRGASGHEHSPFLLLKRAATTESHGEAIGLSLVYSGNFLAEVEVDPFDTARARIGIAPEAFAWTVDPGGAFEAPEAVLVHSASGLGALSDAYHRLYRERLARGQWRDRVRPVLINNWEGTYFDFDEQRLLTIASSAAAMGIELFVLDDGWFGERDDDTSSLGDWTVDRRKLPNGIDSLARWIEELGMAFGLWIEPEMVSPRSRLFAAHPDWAIGSPGRPRTEGRHQYVLDMSRPDVVDHLFRALSDVLGSAPITYVKWDMNRNITEPYGPALPPERQGEFFHRYMLGVYDLYRRLTSAFPHVLFESCAGGGGRFDPGILAFAPQGWTSDDTDAVERIRIQWGTSMVYPLSAMGAHVSATPNHQVGRITPLATRASVAFFGVFGYELDPTTMTADDRRAVSEQVAFYRVHRELFQRGRFIRLVSPFEGDGNEAAWMSVADDARSAVVGTYRVLNRPYPGPDRLRLRGLDPALRYGVSIWPNDVSGRPSRAVERGGDELMSAGLVLDPGRDESRSSGDFWARLFVLHAT